MKKFVEFSQTIILYIYNKNYNLRNLSYILKINLNKFKSINMFKRALSNTKPINDRSIIDQVTESESVLSNLFFQSLYLCSSFSFTLLCKLSNLKFIFFLRFNLIDCFEKKKKTFRINFRDLIILQKFMFGSSIR